MDIRKAVKLALEDRRWSQQRLADEAGFKSQSNISGILNRGVGGVSTDKILAMLDALGYEMQIVDKYDRNKGWRVTRHDGQKD